MRKEQIIELVLMKTTPVGRFTTSSQQCDFEFLVWRYSGRLLHLLPR